MTTNKHSNAHRKSGISAYTNLLPLYEALTFYENLGAQNVHDRLLQIGQWLRAGLSAPEYAGKFELITPLSSDISCVMTCFRINGILSETVYSILKEQYGIQVKHSTEGFPVVSGSVNGAVRISPHYNNTEKEFKNLAKALCEIAGVNKKYWPDFPS